MDDNEPTEMAGLDDPEPNSFVLNALPAAKGGKIRFNVDSGCATTAVRKDTAPDYEVKACAADGKRYTSATGHDVKVEGEVVLYGKHNGSLRAMRAKKFDIRRNLMSVKDMVRAGHRVVFDQDAEGNDTSHAIHRETLEKISFICSGNTWDIEFDLIPAEDVEAAKGEARHLAQLRKRKKHPNGHCSRR